MSASLHFKVWTPQSCEMIPLWLTDSLIAANRQAVSSRLWWAGSNWYEEGWGIHGKKLHESTPIIKPIRIFLCKSAPRQTFCHLACAAQATRTNSVSATLRDPASLATAGLRFVWWQSSASLCGGIVDSRSQVTRFFCLYMFIVYTLTLQIIYDC